MPVLTPPAFPLLSALRAAGLDDDAARFAAWFSPAQRDADAAASAQHHLQEAGHALRGILRDLTPMADTVRATLGVDWRSAAASEYMGRAEALLAEAEGLVAAAQEWLALLAVAEREAEDARRAAEERVRRAEAEAHALLAGLGAA